MARNHKNNKRMAAVVACLVASSFVTSVGATELPAETAVVAESTTVTTIADGMYTVPVSLVKAQSDSASMAANALDDVAQVIVEDGEITVYFGFKPIEVTFLKGYLKNAYYYENEGDFNAAIAADDATGYIKPMTVVTTIDGTDYPEIVSYNPSSLEEVVYVNFDIKAGFVSRNENARIKVDLSNLQAID